MVSLLRQAARRLPRPVRFAIGQKLADLTVWRSEQARLRGERREYRTCLKEGVVPPARMWTMVGAEADFVQYGRAFFDFLTDHGGITRQSTVLDVGCGLGKTAMHFATYLRSPGFYEGFDVELESVRWAQRAITTRFPLIRFRYVPLSSEMYNPRAADQAASFRFPYDDETFDLVFLASVFTHMFDAEVQNYIREIARVLKPGGRCIATFYLMNDDKRAGIAAKTSAFTFSIPFRGSLIERTSPPEGAVAHEEARVFEMVAEAGLTAVDHPWYGAWATDNRQDQDFLVWTKDAA